MAFVVIYDTEASRPVEAVAADLVPIDLPILHANPGAGSL
jgi:hypothetical protein